VVWLLLSVGLAVAELFSLDLVFLMVAAGALGAAGAAALTDSLLVQALVFSVVSVLALVAVRPVARRHLHRGTGTPTGIEALEGASALVLERVDEHAGLVKIRGEQWTARPYDATQVLEPGDTAQVVTIKGATALVWRQP